MRVRSVNDGDAGHWFARFDLRAEAYEGIRVPQRSPLRSFTERTRLRQFNDEARAAAVAIFVPQVAADIADDLVRQR